MEKKKEKKKKKKRHWKAPEKQRPIDATFQSPTYVKSQARSLTQY